MEQLTLRGRPRPRLGGAEAGVLELTVTVTAAVVAGAVEVEVGAAASRLSSPVANDEFSDDDIDEKMGWMTHRHHRSHRAGRYRHGHRRRRSLHLPLALTGWLRYWPSCTEPREVVGDSDTGGN